MSAAERLAGTTELLEMVLLALPLRDMLLVRRVSRTCRALAENSAGLKDIRNHPVVATRLHDGSVASLQSPTFDVEFTLRFHLPVTIRRIPSPLADLSSFVYAFEKGTPEPTTFPRYSLGAKFRARALRLSAENEWKHLELLPGTPVRLSIDLEGHQERLGCEHPWIPNNPGLGLKTGRTYIFGVKPRLSLPAYKGRRRFLLDQVEAGKSLEQYRFHGMYEGHIIQPRAVGKALPIQGENQGKIQVTDLT